MGEKFWEIIQKTFLSREEFANIPQSVLSLGAKEWAYNYDTPDSVIFSTVSSEYGINPRELLEYTMDELGYLMNALQYKYLNEDQKKELQRLKVEKEVKENKKEIDSSVANINDYFNKIF